MARRSLCGIARIVLTLFPIAVLAAACAGRGQISSSAAAAPTVGAQAYQSLLGYTRQAPYRSGTEGDARLAAWLASELRSLGYEPAIEEHAFQRYAVGSAALSVDGFAPEVFPLYYSGRTAPAGIEAALVDIGSGSAAEAAAARDAIAVVEAPLLFNFFTPTLDAAMRNAAAAGARALVVALQGPGNAIVVKNVDAGTGLCGLPVLLVGAEDGRRLRAQAGRKARFTLDAALEPAMLRNVVATLPGTGSDVIVIGTPMNGWFTAAAERGSGVAAWLQLARLFAQAPRGSASLVFVATGGHEIGYLGLPAFMERHADLLPRTGAYVHLGASLAARDYADDTAYDAAVPLNFYVSENPLLLSAVQRTMRDGGRLLGGFTAPSMLNPGEQRAMYQRGIPIAAASATHRWFHTAGDLPEMSSPALLAPVVEGYRALIEQLQATPAAQLRAANRLAQGLAKPAPAAACLVPPGP